MQELSQIGPQHNFQNIKKEEVLKQVFGFDSFRDPQAAIIDNVLGAKNTLAIMPTGGGKSLCYQIPAIMFEGITVVISPLISLMQDQVRQLDELGIQSCYLNSSLTTEEYQTNIQRITNNQIKLLFLAPETALQAPILSVLSQCQINCIAIDEAHCISEWGHEFRPEYRQLNILLEQFDNAVCLALTATATPRVREDIKRQLAISDNSEYLSSFDRPNLYIAVTEKDNPYRQTKSFIDKHTGQSGIVYCQSRAGVKELTQKLCADGYSALAYHAGLTSQQRTSHQDKFVNDDVDIIVATIAFGMGINKPDVRYVIHYDLPKNIESYYQQIGRAGRDSLDAECLLLFGYGDTGKNRFFIDQMQNEQEKRLATMHLNQMLALAETEDCRRVPLLRYFGEQVVSERCNKCDNCLSEDKQLDDLSVPAQKFLSCIYRTDQIFGAGHVIDVLRGSNAEKVLQNQHNLLSTYGIGKEFSKKQWMALSRQLIQKGFLHQDEKFGGLKFTEKTPSLLKGHEIFMGRLQKSEPEASKRTSSQVQSVEGEQDLVLQLKTLRKSLADRANVPPYAVFSDRSLQEMAFFFPHSQDSFLQIHGVGHSKVNKYADGFISVIRDYCQQHNLNEQPNNAKASTPKTTKSSSLGIGAKTEAVAQAFNTGLSVEHIAREQKVKPNTVYSHLLKYVQAGSSLSNKAHLLSQIDVNAEILNKAVQAFEQSGAERLKPVFDALGEQVSYEKLQLIRVYFLQIGLEK